MRELPKLIRVLPHVGLELTQVVFCIVYMFSDLIHFPKMRVFKTDPLSQKSRLTYPSWFGKTDPASPNEKESFVAIRKPGVPHFEHLAVPTFQNETSVQSGICLPPKNRLEDLNVPRDLPTPQLLGKAVDNGNGVQRELHRDDAEVVENIHELRLQGKKHPATQVVEAYCHLPFRRSPETYSFRRVL
ncbi:hypothetical protein AXF42_Ash017821 [Apostasia shenzhenica]|uniref:Uncharacterized protein n=1 Tax=Apostasia shenzhenica TaxID=1088818 RepID=A0A2I0A3V0_9ASPA|nr:hypothetical protein AXF42_Ash017821 [Apostasia shenzhenica]